MARDNPGRPIELCAAVVDGIWKKRRELIESRIPERFKDASIADLGYQADEIIDAVREILEPPSDSNRNIGLIFCGPVGSGKTHSAYAVIRMISDKNPEMMAHMLNYSQSVSEIKHEFVTDSQGDLGSTWDRMTNYSGMYDGLLFIDDVTSQKLTDFESEKMLMFFEKRFNSFMPFLLTTNVDPEDFKAVFGERISSRLFGYCKILFFEGDKRLEK